LPSTPPQIHLLKLPRRELPGGLTVLVASTRRARRRGLSGVGELPRDHALLLPGCRSVHTIGMRFALDLLWLDAEGALLRVDHDVPARRVRTCVRASAVIECGAGNGDRFAACLAVDAAPPRADPAAAPQTHARPG
jgi:uncharacterized membrane protein (UPF0127 family)